MHLRVSIKGLLTTTLWQYKSAKYRLEYNVKSKLVISYRIHQKFIAYLTEAMSWTLYVLLL